MVVKKMLHLAGRGGDSFMRTPKEAAVDNVRIHIEHFSNGGSAGVVLC